MEKHNDLLLELVEKKIIKAKQVFMASAILMALEKDGIIYADITGQDNNIYLGPIKIFELPKND